MKSRSDWLKFAGKGITNHKEGRKRFNIHKNQHKCIIYPESPSKGIEKTFTREKNITNSHSVRRVETFKKLEPIETSFYKQIIQEKDLEISHLKNLYSETNKRLLECEVKIASPSDNKLKKTHSDVFLRRRGLTPDFKRNNFLDYARHPAFSQPKFTKNTPKIVLSNPITGIAPRIDAYI
ncbi:hypothetical protein SteCoe_8888 [Stentor coeruleus]|uniref:Uncharacterized protein n=1 Tax=Stentor coeruleus TaxID=5963 RepID=A0A1R2CJ55_9CILI|nr:hypothetical protein SteCoe_8888 [Stentor coeruleus]